MAKDKKNKKNKTVSDYFKNDKFEKAKHEFNRMVRSVSAFVNEDNKLCFINPLGKEREIANFFLYPLRPIVFNGIDDEKVIALRMMVCIDGEILDEVIGFKLKSLYNIKKIIQDQINNIKIEITSLKYFKKLYRWLIQYYLDNGMYIEEFIRIGWGNKDGNWEHIPSTAKAATADNILVDNIFKTGDNDYKPEKIAFNNTMGTLNIVERKLSISLFSYALLAYIKTLLAKVGSGLYPAFVIFIVGYNELISNELLANLYGNIFDRNITNLNIIDYDYHLNFNSLACEFEKKIHEMRDCLLIANDNGGEEINKNSRALKDIIRNYTFTKSRAPGMLLGINKKQIAHPSVVNLDTTNISVGNINLYICKESICSYYQCMEYYISYLEKEVNRGNINFDQLYENAKKSINIIGESDFNLVRINAFLLLAYKLFLGYAKESPYIKLENYNYDALIAEATGLFRKNYHCLTDGYLIGLIIFLSSLCYMKNRLC